MKHFLDTLPPLGRSIVVSALILGGFAALSTTLLSITSFATHDAIEESEKQALLRNLHELLPADKFNNDLLSDRISVQNSLLGTSAPMDVYRARHGSTDVAVIISTLAPKGYNGRINILVGIYVDGTVAGVRITAHRETPGLGDEIELAKSDWVLGFNGKSLGAPTTELWEVKKDGGEFDQFTGATITPRVVVAAVRNTLKFYQGNKEMLFKRAPNPQTSSIEPKT